MTIFLTLAFLFFIGSTLGWVVELLFRRFFSSANPERKWINPGFCTGPYLPIYGFGLCILYLIAGLEQYNFISNPFWNKVVLFFVMAICMTAIEYIVGIVSLKVAKVRLWDYSKAWGNIQGIICPKFSLIGAILGAVYYYLIHSRILQALDGLSQNLAFSFVIGLFFGFFIVDVIHSANLVAKRKNTRKKTRLLSARKQLKPRSANERMKENKSTDFSRPSIPISLCPNT